METINQLVTTNKMLISDSLELLKYKNNFKIAIGGLLAIGIFLIINEYGLEISESSVKISKKI